MKVLDPQSALLTTAEVYDFFSTNPVRPAEKPSGSYKPVNLDGYLEIRNDFDQYTRTAVSHVRCYPPLETYMHRLSSQLRQFGLTKTEALMLIDLGIGLNPSKTAEENKPVIVNGDTDTDASPSASSADETNETNHTQKMSLVIEELQERFPGSEGEETIQQIIQILKDCLKR